MCAAPVAAKKRKDAARARILQPASPAVELGTVGKTPWSKLVVENAAPRLTDRLMKHPKLSLAAQSPELLLATLKPGHKAAALKLLHEEEINQEADLDPFGHGCGMD